MAYLMSFPSAGHHSKDPGAIANGHIESELMNNFRNKVISEFIKNKRSYITDYNTENNPEYQSRIKPRKGDVIADFHLNASSNPSATGVEVIISNNAGAQSKKFAKELVEGLAGIMNIPNRGVKPESQTARKKIGILNLPGTAVLIEFCFISNPSDVKKFLSHENEIAAFVASKIFEYDTNM